MAADRRAVATETRSPALTLQRINLREILLSSLRTICEVKQILRLVVPTMQRREMTAVALRASSSTLNCAAAPRLITPDEAIGRIRLLLKNPRVEDKQYLLSLAGIAIAAVIVLDGEAIDVEEIDGLQESVNRALFRPEA